MAGDRAAGIAHQPRHDRVRTVLSRSRARVGSLRNRGSRACRFGGDGPGDGGGDLGEPPQRRIVRPGQAVAQRRPDGPGRRWPAPPRPKPIPSASTEPARAPERAVADRAAAGARMSGLPMSETSWPTPSTRGAIAQQDVEDRAAAVRAAHDVEPTSSATRSRRVPGVVTVWGPVQATTVGGARSRPPGREHGRESIGLCLL